MTTRFGSFHIIEAGTLEHYPHQTAPVPPGRGTRTVPARPRTDEWQQRAACAGQNPDWWFPDESSHGHIHTPHPTAVRLCAGCSVAGQCLDYAHRTRSHGWWANTDTAQRTQQRRQTPRRAP